MQKSEIAAQKPYLLESVFVNSVNNRIKFVQKGEIAAQKTYFCIFFVDVLCYSAYNRDRKGAIGKRSAPLNSD